MLQVSPTYNYGATNGLIRGPEAGFQLDVTVSNIREASYGTVLIINSADYISYIKVVAVAPSTVTCSPRNSEDLTKSVLECQLSDLETPFVTGRTDIFTIHFDASKTPVVNNFTVDLKLETKSKDVNLIDNNAKFTVKVESKADIDFTG